jgi:hypothetical protein
VLHQRFRDDVGGRSSLLHPEDFTVKATISKARKLQRNNLRAYLAGWGVDLPPGAGEVKAASAAKLARKGRAIRDKIDHKPVLPTTAHRTDKLSVDEWTRGPNKKPLMHKKGRH